MTAREIDMLREFLGREIQQLRAELRDMRDEARSDHALVRRDVQALAARVDQLEDDDQIEHSRREFRRSLMRGVVTAQAAMVGVLGLALAALQQFHA